MIEDTRCAGLAVSRTHKRGFSHLDDSRRVIERLRALLFRCGRRLVRGPRNTSPGRRNGRARCDRRGDREERRCDPEAGWGQPGKRRRAVGAPIGEATRAAERGLSMKVYGSEKYKRLQINSLSDISHNSVEGRPGWGRGRCAVQPSAFVA
jgi:hypothetical protein